MTPERKNGDGPPPLEPAWLPDAPPVPYPEPAQPVTEPDPLLPPEQPLIQVMATLIRDEPDGVLE